MSPTFTGGDQEGLVPQHQRGEPGKLRSLLRLMSGAFALQTTGSLLNLAGQSVMARYLGAQLFGQYSLAVTTSQLLATPADLGTSQSAMRFLPEYAVKDEAALTRGFLVLARVLPLAVSFFIGGVTAAVVSFVGLAQPTAGLMLAAAAGVPLFALTLALMNVLRALGGLFWAIGPTAVLQPLMLLTAVLVLPRGGSLTYVVVTEATLLTTICVQALCLHVKTRGLRPSTRAYSFRYWFSVSLPLLVINLVQLVFQRLDIVAVGLFLGAREAGIYTIANRLAVAAASLQKAMLTVVAPQMSALHWSEKHDELERLVLNGMRLVILPAALVTLVLVVAGRPILGLVSDPYTAGYAALVVYSLGQLIGVGAGPVGWLASIIGEQRAMARITIVSALIAAACYVVLIPLLGIVGAAAGNSLGVIYRNWASSRLTRRQGFRISLVRALRSGR